MNDQTRPPTGDDLLAEIERLRKERNAVILAHYYQRPEIQDLADFVDDSLDLSRRAAATDADMIVFSLEETCLPDDFARCRAAHPDHIALTYINCSAEVKALSDIIVTSSNAEHIINQLPQDQPILFAPDKHLGAYLTCSLALSTPTKVFRVLLKRKCRSLSLRLS